MAVSLNRAIKIAWRYWGICTRNPEGTDKATSLYKAVILLQHTTAVLGDPYCRLE